MAHISIIPRLLSRDEAAAYIGMSRNAFERHCNVAPIRFGDQRLLRWDRFDLDAWIETRKVPSHANAAVLTEADMDRDLEAWDG